MRLLRVLWLCVGVLVLAGCATNVASQTEKTPFVRVVTHTPSAGGSPAISGVTSEPEEHPLSPATTPQAPVSESAGPTAVPTATFDPESWMNMPVIPTLSPRAMNILKDGLSRGNNARVFSKIGDCESRSVWFLGDFDQGPQYYALGSYQTELAPVIEYYAGSFNRLSMAATPGFTAASLMSPIWADKAKCEKNEGPLACEYRLNRPALAFILLGSNDASNPKTFEGHMRKVIEYSIEQGVLPILGTKADNTEGNYAINATIARLAYEYDLPLWNYWRAVQDLPNQGLQEDGVHLTFATSFFDNPESMKRAWPVRNLNALQILKLVMDSTK